MINKYNFLRLNLVLIILELIMTSILPTLGQGSHSTENRDNMMSFDLWWAPLLIVMIVGMCIWIIFAYWIYKDAKTNHIKNPLLWAFLVLIFPMMGLIVYLIVKSIQRTSTTNEYGYNNQNLNNKTINESSRQYCNKCGSSNDLDSIFCQNCGITMV